MDERFLRRLKNKGTLSNEIATRSTDPGFYGALNYLPNPDKVLRKLGKSQDVYDDIIADAHVIGDIRSVRSGLLSYEWRLQPGGESDADLRAHELCQKVFSRTPYKGMTWSDLIWTFGVAVFRGYTVHEVVWQREDQYLLPYKIVDRPQDRFIFDADNNIRIKTRSNLLQGEELGDYKWLLTRHMAEFRNPYGVALLSSCFWPYTFKHSGFKYFVKFCEKYGLPWAVGKYPSGTEKKDQDALADSLATMVEDAVAAIPNDASIELIQASGGGKGSHHETLINICNREMSKALTSQTLATEIQGNGSRAASETHRGREQSVNESDREMIAASLDTLCHWITELNIPGALPPKFEFFEEAKVRQDWAGLMEKARKYIDIPRQFAHEKLGIPIPEEGADVISSSSNQPGGGEFPFTRCNHCGGTHHFATGEQGDVIDALTEQAATQADALFQQFGKPVVDLLESVDSLEAFRDGLDDLYPKIDADQFAELVTLATMTSRLKGMSDAEDGK
ncbi:MAG TPA: DUF935 family protein [Acidiferrobacteraceae bacterium]|nr:DUF935 family protein [Acidiferrobacteraceae bacterium]